MSYAYCQVRPPLSRACVMRLDASYVKSIERSLGEDTSIGRFWRLYLRNVAGFLLHQNDKGTFGNTWRVVLAENEDSLAKMEWPTVAADMGAAPYQKHCSDERSVASSFG